MEDVGVRFSQRFYGDVLGAGAPFLDIPIEALREAIAYVFHGKASEVIETNIKGFDLGLKRGGNRIE